LAERAAEEERIQRALGKVKHSILVMSGKGGVGKSTVAVNLAVALARAGRKVGLLDVDLHGPTVPVLLGLVESRPAVLGDMLVPIEHASGVKMISMGNLLDIADRAVIWRGPKKIGAIRQFIGDVEWGDLDYLIIDSPPGTGDEPLTVAQTVPGVLALVVTTPQEVSLADVRKSINFCQTVEMPIVGVIENMSGYLCPACGHIEPIFGAGGGGEMARSLGLAFLGAVPIEPAIVRGGDHGKPYVDEQAETSAGKSFRAIIANLEAEVVRRAAPKPEAAPAVATGPAAAVQSGADGTQVICVPTYDGQLTQHFGHAETMTFFTVRGGKIVGQENRKPPEHAPGVIPRWVAEQGAHVILAGGMGSHAQELFQAGGVQVVCGAPALAARLVVEQYLAGELVTGQNACDH